MAMIMICTYQLIDTSITVKTNGVGLTRLLFDYALEYLAASLYQTTPPFRLHFYANQPS